MEAVLDYIFHHFVRILAVGMVLLFAGIALGRLEPFKKKIPNRIYQFFCFTLFMQWAIVSAFLSPHYGYANNLVKMLTDGEKIFLLDETVSTTEGETEYYYRLYAVNAADGKKIKRMYVGNSAELFFLSGRMLFIRSKTAYSLLDKDNFRTMRTYDQDTLHREYPRLAPGVARIRYADNQLYIASKNGRLFYLEPLQGILHDALPDRKPATAARRIMGDSIIFSGPAGKNTTGGIYFQPVSGTVLKKMALSHGPVRLHSPDFIEPKLLTFFSERGIVLVFSHETTDKKSFIMTACDINSGKVAWQKRQSDIDPGGYKKDSARLTAWMKYKNDFVFNSGGRLIRIGAGDGRIIWNRRL